MKRGTAVFTIIAKNYLPYARVLMRSVAEHHPDWHRFVILTDRIDGAFDPDHEDFEIVRSEDLEIPRPRWFHFKYTILELSTAVKPYAFEHLFAAHSFDRIVYLDPDIKVFSPMRRITEALDSANIALTPHLTGSLEDDRRPAEIDILRSGAYNLGFIGVARSGVSADFLSWWKRRLYDHCVVDLARGLFVDQRWVDLVPGLFEGVAIVRDPGYNVAYWNLTHRIVSFSESALSERALIEQRYEVAGSPLSFFHFSGYDPDQPGALSRHQNRHKVQDLSVATQQLLSSYRDDLLAAGYATCRKWTYAFGAFDNGIQIPDMARPVHHEAAELPAAIDDPFSDEGYDACLAIWNEPVQEEMSDRAGISRLAYRIYRTRTDVQSVMPDIFGGNYRRFLEWMLVDGKAEHGLGEVFLTTIADAIRTCKDRQDGPAWLDTTAPNAFSNELDGDGGAHANGGTRLRLTRLAVAIYQGRPELQRYFPDPSGRDGPRFLVWLLTYGRKEHNLSARHIAPMQEQWRSVIRSLPSWPLRLRYELTLRAMAASVFLRAWAKRLPVLSTKFGRLRSQPVAAIARADGNPGRAEAGPALDFGVNLVGYLHSETGTGQSARASHASLRAAAVPTSIRLVNDTGFARHEDRTVGPASVEFPYFANLFHVNADQTAVVRKSIGESFYRDRYNIASWNWELEEFPDRWIGAFALYQEIWTPSHFCRAAVSRDAPIPVHRVPIAICPVAPVGMDRQYFGLSPDRFIFLFAFDVQSALERKNPLAAIRAFERAFGGDPRYQLVLKVNNAGAAPAAVETLKSACCSGAVRFMDSTITREEMYALIQCADCVVSLHRSEGFGLLIAEAMYFGKPVIVTNYSGNTDFTRPDNSLLVNYRLIPVGRNCEPYDARSLWADPDVEHAAAHMRSVAKSPGLRTRLSRAGSEFVRETLSAEAVGRIMRQRFEVVRQARRVAGKAAAMVAGADHSHAK